MSRNVNIYYFSKYSETCLNLLRLMDAHGIKNKFLMMCVDDMHELPTGLERIPTLIISGIPKPFVGNDALQWFNDNKVFFAQQTAEIQSKMHLYNMAKSADGSTMNGFIDCEHKGISDEYAYADTDMPQPKSFVEYGSDGNVIFTPPIDGKIKEDVQKRLIRDAVSQRNNQEDEYKKNMKQDQINILFMKEREKLMDRQMGI